MEFSGRVQNGVVVLEGVPALPEGAKVTVSYYGPIAGSPAVKKQRIQVPRIQTGEPGEPLALQNQLPQARPLLSGGLMVVVRRKRLTLGGGCLMRG